MIYSINNDSKSLIKNKKILQNWMLQNSKILKDRKKEIHQAM